MSRIRSIPPGRQRLLLAFYQQHGMKEDARQAQLVLEAVGK
jgi:hypothetical protein